MLDGLSPDGQIGSPLQAIGFLLAILCGSGIVLFNCVDRLRQAGWQRTLRDFYHLDTVALLAFGVLAIANLYHHAFAPLEGVFRPEVGDGGLVEDLTIFVMALPVVWFAARVFNRQANSQFGHRFMSGLCLLLIIAVGEEVSWGQHWFGFDIPDVVAETNLQGEINVHNYIAPQAMELIYFIAGMVLIGVAATMDSWFHPSSDNHASGLPLQALLAFAGMLMCHHIFQELAELAVVMSGFLIWKRLDDGRLVFTPDWARRLAHY